MLKAVLDRYEGVRQIQLVTDNTSKTTAFYKSMGISELGDIGDLCFKGLSTEGMAEIGYGLKPEFWKKDMLQRQ